MSDELVPETPMPCPDCDSTLRRVFVKKYRKLRYVCDRAPSCRGAIGCHPDGRPLGVPANRDTRLARMRAHAAFDTLWQSGAMKRGEAYAWLAQQMGTERVNIAELDIEGCKHVVMFALNWKYRRSEP